MPITWMVKRKADGILREWTILTENPLTKQFVMCIVKLNKINRYIKISGKPSCTTSISLVTYVDEQQVDEAEANEDVCCT
jgi:hypothetical protein